MTPDIKLATVQTKGQSSMGLKSDPRGKQNFSDALGETPSRAGQKGDGVKGMTLSLRDRLQAALNDSLNQNTPVPSEEEITVGTVVAVAADTGEIDPESEAETEPETAQDKAEKKVLVALPAYLHTRDIQPAANAATRTFEARPATGRGAGANSDQPATAEEGTMDARAALTMAADASMSGKDQAAGRKESINPALADMSGQSVRTSAGTASVEAGIVTKSAQKPSEKTATPSAVQIQVISADPGATPAQAVGATIRAEPSWAAYFRDTGGSPAHSIKALKIQLHPAELGMVTAQLRAAGDSLEIEITAETVEAHKHLAAEADDILRSLRQVGIDVDKISVHVADNGPEARNGQGQEWRNFSSFQGQERRDGEAMHRGRDFAGNGVDGGAPAQSRESSENQSAGRYI